ncbi:MAG: aminopeptidase, partial [Clostridia bacterium]
MRDSRLDRLADVLVNYSCRIKKGEKILIEAKNADYSVVSAIVEKVYEAGGFPFVQVYDNRVTRAINMG